jgi:DNA invertase Pin-like site-specific DNA recombinase
MKEVQIIKASKDKVIRSGATIKNKIRVAPYARVSTDSDEQKNSYESQKKYYQELVFNNPEWELVDIYADEAISGTQVYKRTDFMRMINDAMEGKIDMIITKSISRFARNTLDTLSFVRQLKDKGVAVFFEKENINTLTMNGELLLVILSSLAQQESESIGGNIKLGLKMKMSCGEMVGFNRCLGYSYDKDTKEISIVPEEAEIVRYIFKRYIEGIGTYALAKELTRKGFKNAKGEVKWRDGSVACILKTDAEISGHTNSTNKKRSLNNARLDIERDTC